MVAPIKVHRRIGRNAPCPCGSKKKYKYCCGSNGGLQVPDPTKRKVLSQQGLIRCLLKLVKDAGGAVNIPCKDIDEIPKEEQLGFIYNSDDDSFDLKMLKIKISPILQPGGRRMEVVQEEEEEGDNDN